MGEEQEHVIGSDGQFHVEDEAVDISVYGWEDWITFALFWIMAAVVFYQVYTRYVLADSAGWTEEIARYFLVAVVFIGASMSVRKNNHIQVDYFYRLIQKRLGRVLSTLVDVVRCVFLGYAVWLTWLLAAHRRLAHGGDRPAGGLGVRRDDVRLLAHVPALAAGGVAALEARLQRPRAA